MRTVNRFFQIMTTTTLVLCAGETDLRAAECTSACSPSECSTSSNDCNGNAVVDRVDIDQGTSIDCNGNRIPDECEFPDTLPIDLVFVLDTSGSMCERFADLCGSIASAITQLDQAGSCVRWEVLPIQQQECGDLCDCCTTSVPDLYCPGLFRQVSNGCLSARVDREVCRPYNAAISSSLASSGEAS